MYNIYNTMHRTEPMNIGSPTSPSGRQQNSFLPAFLMGESSNAGQLTPNSKPWGILSSPGCSSLNRSSANQNLTSFQNSSRNELFPGRTDVPAQSAGRKRNGGPPVKGLFEIVPSCGTLPFKLENNDSQLASAGRSFQLEESLNGCQQLNPGKGAMSSNCDYMPADKMKRASSLSHLASPHDSYSFQGELASSKESVDETWVTIFGFPTTSESVILQEFSSFGTIVRHLLPAEGNWMHVQFQNQRQANKALSKHGKVLSGYIMIGVKPCIEKAVLDLNKENSVLVMKPTCMNSSVVSSDNAACQELHRPQRKPSSIRPLASGNQAQPSSAGLKRKNSIVSKAMGYVFGW